MAWIEQIDEAVAEGELKELYDELAARRGKIANIMKVHSLNPGAMHKHLELYMHLMFGQSQLTRAEREALAVVVSATNNCAYCVNHHAEALSRYEKDNQKLKQLMSGLQFMDMPDRQSRMLRYAVKLTTFPEKIRESDIDALREVGFTDKDVLDINLITSYFNFVNRIALGLGVAYSDEEASGYTV